MTSPDNCSAAYVRGDAIAMTEIYTPDAVLFPEPSAPIWA